MSQPRPLMGAALAALLLLLPACGDEVQAPPAPPRPVVTTTLALLAPNPPLVLTGVAEPYREAEVSFEVAGRITAILDVGRTVEVRTREKTPTELAAETKRRDTAGDGGVRWKVDPLVHTGDIIAQMEDTTYRQRLEGAQLRLKTAESGLRAQELDLKEVSPATVARAKAQRDAARADIASARAGVQSAESNKKTTGADLERSRQLLRDKQISKAEFDQAQNGFDNAEANLAQAKAGLDASQQKAAGSEASVTEAEASLRLKAETVATTRAQIAELVVAVQQAQTDLARCTLRAPFSGRITYAHASQGDFVGAGSPVLRLTLIDPIKVSVTVSADHERAIQPGNYARVQPKEFASFETGDGELFGTVFEKGAVADPATRTFRIDVMVRNARRRLAVSAPPDALRIGFRELLPAVERNFGEGGPLFVASSCCVPEGGERVVYRVKGASFGRPRTQEIFEKPLVLERVVLRVAGSAPEDFMQILNWSFRRAEPANGVTLKNGDLLINFQRLDPAKIQKGVVLERFEWAVRPGDLVPVIFSGAPSPKGFWVPDDAIRAQNAGRSIFQIKDGKALEIPVTVHESAGRLRRIEGAGLSAGLKLVVVGVHYVFDGADVVVSREIDLGTFVGGGR